MPNIRTEVRIKPSKRNVLRCSGKTVTAGTRTYEFDSVHTTTTQQDLFESSVRPLVDLFISGRDCSVIAYGQTGSGKTYTIGISPKSRDAMVQYTLSYLFSQGHRPSCSFIEIYNEEIIDLLAEDREALSLRATGGPESRSTACIVGLTEAPLDSLATAMRLLRLGCANRTTKSTRMNSESSRSHAVYTLRLPRGCAFSFVDLAGSERLKRTLCRGVAARESIAINTGLLALGNVISALYLGKSHVPFRDSKLTRILEPCLSSHLLIVACISALPEDLGETANTLKYAGRAARISVAERVSVVEDKSRAEIVRLEREISRLKDENNRLRLRTPRGDSNLNIQDHPYVKKLEREVEDLKQEIEKLSRGVPCEKYMEVETKDESIGYSGDVAGKHMNKPVICDNTNTITNGNAAPLVTNQQNNNIPQDIEQVKIEVEKNTHKRIVSFNLEPRPKRSFFTPRKESVRISPVKNSSLPHSTTALCAADGTLVACLTNGPVLAITEREDPLFDEQGITCIAYSSAFGLFYAVGSLLKVFCPGSRPVPVYACASAITSLAVSGTTVFLGHADGSLSLFDLVGNAPVFAERVHTGAVLGLSQIGTILYTASRDHSIRYSTIDGSTTPCRVHLLRDAHLSPPHYDSVTCLLNYKDTLVSLSRDCSIKTWRGSEPHKTIPGAHSSWIKCGAVAEHCWLSGCKDGELRCWDLMDGSVRCVGKATVGQSIERIAVIEDRVWVGCRKEMFSYSLR